MSYEIVKRVRANDNGTITIKSASNNVYPKDYYEWQSDYKHENNKYTGKTGAEIQILSAYDSGDFQGGNNKYTRALSVLRNMPEYHKYNWRDNWEESRENTGTPEYFELLKKALNTPLPKERYVIYKDLHMGGKAYGRYKKGGRALYWVGKDKATKHNFRAEAEKAKERFIYSDNWKVEEV